MIEDKIYKCSKCGIQYIDKNKCIEHEKICDCVKMTDVSIRYWNNSWDISVLHYVGQKQNKTAKISLCQYMGHFPSEQYTDEQAVEIVKEHAMDDLAKSSFELRQKTLENKS